MSTEFTTANNDTVGTRFSQGAGRGAALQTTFTEAEWARLSDAELAQRVFGDDGTVTTLFELRSLTATWLWDTQERRAEEATALERHRFNNAESGVGDVLQAEANRLREASFVAL